MMALGSSQVHHLFFFLKTTRYRVQLLYDASDKGAIGFYEYASDEETEDGMVKLLGYDEFGVTIFP